MEATAAAPIASTSTLVPSSNASTSSSALSLNRQRTHVQLGDSVLLQLPSKNIKVFKLVEGANIINLGKYGSFDARTQLIGRPYGVTLEIVPPTSGSSSPAPNGSTSTSVPVQEGEASTSMAVQDNIGDKEIDPKRTDKKSKDKYTRQPLCTLRPYEEVIEEIEVTEATNENILASGAKVRLTPMPFRSLSLHFG